MYMGFPKIKDTCLEVPIIRADFGIYVGVPLFQEPAIYYGTMLMQDFE